MRSLWRDCARKVFFRYIAGIKSKSVPKYFVIGSGFHRGLESFRDQPQGERSMVQGCQVAAQAMVNDYQGKFPPDVMKVMIGQVTAYLMAYAEYFADDNALELKPEGRAFGDNADGEVGYLDCLAYVDGKVYLIEDKTTASFDEEEIFLMGLKMNDQILTYASALRSRGITLEGIVYRQTLKTKTRVKKTESVQGYCDRILDVYLSDPSDKYRQFVVNFSNEQLDLWDQQREKENLNILSYLDVTNLDLWPFNPRSCISIMGPCEYIHACARRRDARVDRLYEEGKESLDDNKFRDQLWGNLNTDTEEGGESTSGAPF